MGKGEDDAGYLFSKVLTSDGATGELETIGDGSSSNKDALISLVVRMSNSNDAHVNLSSILMNTRIGRDKKQEEKEKHFINIVLNFQGTLIFTFRGIFHI